MTSMVKYGAVIRDLALANGAAVSQLSVGSTSDRKRDDGVGTILYQKLENTIFFQFVVAS